LKAEYRLDEIIAMIRDFITENTVAEGSPVPAAPEKEDAPTPQGDQDAAGGQTTPPPTA
jgi:hypothetical protein